MAQTILSNKQSTYGSPYAFYTVEVTTSGRVENSITCVVTIKANLQYAASWLGKGYTLTAYIGLNGTAYEIPLKSSSESWSGTTVHTVTKFIVVTGLSTAQTSMTSTFRVDSTADGSSAGLTSITCSSITFSAFNVEAPDAPSAPLLDSSKIVVPFVFLGNTWGLGKIIPYIYNGNTWVVASSHIPE